MDSNSYRRRVTILIASELRSFGLKSRLARVWKKGQQDRRRSRLRRLLSEQLEQRHLMVSDAAGDSLSTAMSVILQANQQVEISALIGDGDFGSKDVDLFRVSLVAGQSLQIDVDAKALDNNVALSSLDSYLRVFSSAGIQLAINSSGTSRNDSYASTLGGNGVPPDAYLVF